MASELRDVKLIMFDGEVLEFQTVKTDLNLEKGLFIITDKTGKRIYWAHTDDVIKCHESYPKRNEEELISLLRNNQKILAIKIYYKQTGKSLRESKEYIDNLQARHGL